MDYVDSVSSVVAEVVADYRVAAEKGRLHGVSAGERGGEVPGVAFEAVWRGDVARHFLLVGEELAVACGEKLLVDGNLEVSVEVFFRL